MPRLPQVRNQMPEPRKRRRDVIFTEETTRVYQEGDGHVGIRFQSIRQVFAVLRKNRASCCGGGSEKGSSENEEETAGI